MRLIAVDNERLALKDLMEAISKTLPEAVIEGFNKPAKALESAKKIPVDVAFLDIEMGGMSGLELAKRIKDISGQTNIVFVTGHSQYALDAFSVHASGYLMKPVMAEDIAGAMEHLRHPIPSGKAARLRVQTFGNFEVFYAGEPLHFARSKAKELFAYLIHKRGTGCSTRELASILFEDRPYSLSVQKQVQTILSSMMQTLKQFGLEDCVVRRYNWTAMDVAKVDCDYYRFLDWDVDAVNEYMGEYMANYDWAEFVIGYLDSKVT